MKTKLKFLKMLWRVITGKEKGWVFFKLDDHQQRDIIESVKPVDLRIRYMSVDPRVINKLAERLAILPLSSEQLKVKYEQAIMISAGVNVSDLSNGLSSPTKVNSLVRKELALQLFDQMIHQNLVVLDVIRIPSYDRCWHERLEATLKVVVQEGNNCKEFFNYG